MMQKITNQQAAEQMMQLQQAKEKEPKVDPSFGAQLAQAAMLTQQPQPQPLPAIEAASFKLELSGKTPEAPASIANGPSPEAVSKGQAKIGPAMGETVSAQPAALLKTAVSSKTVSALTGLKPWGKDWVFEGEMPDLNPTQPQAEQATPEKAQARPTRGKAEVAEESVNPKPIAVTERPPTMQDMMQQLMSGTEAATAVHPLVNDNQSMDMMRSIEAMGGVIQENSQGSAAGPVARPVKGKTQQLSGGEFLNMLSTVKAGGIPAKQQLDAQLGQQGQDGGKGEAFDAKPNLRLISGGLKGKKPQFGESLEMSKTQELTAFNSLQNLAGQKSAPSSTLNPVVTGHVVKGANAEERFTSESLAGVSTGIRNLSVQGGGEMRIRLRPENLGELHVRVVTDGKNVGLHIQATDDRAKKIIEDSIGYLKESMASQSLSLGTVDLTVAQSQNASADHHGDQQHSESQSQMFQDMNGRNPGQDGRNSSGREAWGETENGFARIGQRAGIAAAATAAAAAGRTASSSSSRLDVRA